MVLLLSVVGPNYIESVYHTEGLFLLFKDNDL
jgi:hypothetical protein